MTLHAVRVPTRWSCPSPIIIGSFIHTVWLQRNILGTVSKNAWLDWNSANASYSSQLVENSTHCGWVGVRLHYSSRRSTAVDDTLLEHPMGTKIWNTSREYKASLFRRGSTLLLRYRRSSSIGGSTFCTAIYCSAQKIEMQGEHIAMKGKHTDAWFDPVHTCIHLIKYLFDKSNT